MFERKYNNSGSSGSSRGSYSSGPREMHDVTCSECGKQTQVPFKPDGSRPVYCSECYQKHRPARSPRRY
jgi:CxxC-x17-CxxC domain-containing protein